MVFVGVVVGALMTARRARLLDRMSLFWRAFVSVVGRGPAGASMAFPLHHCHKYTAVRQHTKFYNVKNRRSDKNIV